MTVASHQLTAALLGALGLCACSQPLGEGLVVRILVEDDARASCIGLKVRTGSSELDSGPLPRKPELRFSVVRAPHMPQEVTVQAFGYQGVDCADVSRLVRIEETPERSGRFSFPAAELELTLRGATGIDADEDGYVSSAFGGSDCDDFDPSVHPGHVELCSDGKDNDCVGGLDCADATCAEKPCADGRFCFDADCIDPSGERNCGDGLDDDGDGKRDCADPDCDGRTCERANPCERHLCRASQCALEPVVCPPGPECTVGVCIPSDGGCQYLSVDGGQPCDGGSCGADGQCWLDFEFAPSNFDPRAVPRGGGAVSLSCGLSTFDSSADAATPFTNWCGQPLPTPVVVSQAMGPDAVVLPLRGLFIDGGSELRISGTRPVILAVYGDAVVNGFIRAAPADARPQACGEGQAGGGQASNGGGAGGGGFGTSGGNGGPGSTTGNPGMGGAANGNPELMPLRGGCPGGRGGNGGGAGGFGGGAIQLSVARTLRISGAVVAPGARGEGASTGQRGGGGGGSGGAVLLEGRTVTLLRTAFVTANGGGGGEGSGELTAGNPGENGRSLSTTAAPGGGGGSPNGGNGGAGGTADAPPENGDQGEVSAIGTHSGGGGGGGAVGRIRVNAYGPCSADASFSPAPTFGGDGGC